MEQLLFIFGLFQKEFIKIPFISPIIIIAGMILIYRRFVDKIPLEPLDNVKPEGWGFLAIVAVGQTVAFFTLFGEGTFATSYLIKQWISALVFVAVAFIFYLVISSLMTREAQIHNLVTGNFWAMLILLVICAIQIVYVYAGGRFEGLVSLIGHLEYHNPVNQGSFIAGSYTQTMQRVNGLYGESGFLAGVLGVCFSPFILGSIRNHTNLFFPSHKYHPWMYYGMLGILVLALLLAKTSTGILAIAIIMVMLLFSLRKAKERWLLFGLYVIAAVGLGFVVMRVPAFRDMIVQFTVGKTDSQSTTMRVLATLTVLKTAVTHPFVGIGYAQTSYFNFQNAPHALKKLPEYQHYLENDFFPDQSAWGAVLAQFGLVVGALALVYLVHLVVDLHHQAAKLAALKSDERGYDIAIADSSTYFFVIYGILGLLSIQWSFGLFFMMVFFFAGYRHYLDRKLIKTEETIQGDHGIA